MLSKKKQQPIVETNIQRLRPRPPHLNELSLVLRKHVLTRISEIEKPNSQKL